MSWSGYIPGSLVREVDPKALYEGNIVVSDENPDRFVHKQFPYVRESILRTLDGQDYEALVQYLKDQGIEVRP